VLHLDLAARNLLVVKVEDKFEAKVADFGMSKKSNQYDMKNKQIAIRWAAQELLSQGTATPTSDVFSFAVVMWEIFENCMQPYVGKSNQDVATAVLNGERLPKPSICNDKWYEIMLQCWQSDPEDRPTFSSVLQQLQSSEISLLSPFNKVTECPVIITPINQTQQHQPDKGYSVTKEEYN